MNTNIIREDQITRVVEKTALVTQLKQSGLSINAFSRKQGLSVSTVWRANKLSNQSSNPSIFVDKRKDNTSKIKLDDRVSVFAITLFSRHPMAPISSIHRACVEEAKLHQYAVPTYKMIYRLINSLPKELYVSIREGQKEAFAKEGLHSRIDVTSPNEMFCCDHSELPIYIRDSKTQELYKPYLILFVDDYSRAIVGHKLCRNVPNSVDALHALYKTILPKEDSQSIFFGVCSRLRSDRGSIYANGDFAQALLGLSVAWDPAPPNCPQKNGKCERAFETLSQRLLSLTDGFASRFQGLKIANKVALPEVLFLEKLNQYVAEYNSTVHSETNETPLMRWYNGYENCHGLHVSKAIIDSSILVSKKVPVTRSGIHEYGRYWNATELADYINTEVTLRLPLEGVPNKILCYSKSGSLIAELVPSDESFAEILNRKRTERNVDIREIKNVLKEAADRMLGSRDGGLSSLERIEIPNLPTEEKQ